MLLLRSPAVLGLLHEGLSLAAQPGTGADCSPIHRALATQLAPDVDRASAHSQIDRTPSKTVAGDTTAYVVDLAATLPVVISDTEAVYLYGLDIIAQQQLGRDSNP
jgi:hypothetical protein